MSFSFTAKGDTKAEAYAKAREEMDKVVKAQPTHAHDANHVMVTIDNYLQLLPADHDGKEVVLNVSGSISWNGIYPDSHKFISASVGVSAYLSTKAEPAD